MSWWISKDGDNEIVHELMFGNLPDRSLAIVAAAHLDDVLLGAIRRSFRQDDPQLIDRFTGSQAPLGSFSARIDYGFLSGLYGADTRHDLNIVRRIRNDFAHVATRMSFESDSPKALCDNLKLPGKFAKDGMLGLSMDPASVIVVGHLRPVPTEPRERFLLAVEMTTAILSLYQPQPQATPRF